MKVLSSVFKIKTYVEKARADKRGNQTFLKSMIEAINESESSPDTPNLMKFLETEVTKVFEKNKSYSIKDSENILRSLMIQLWMAKP